MKVIDEMKERRNIVKTCDQVIADTTSRLRPLFDGVWYLIEHSETKVRYTVLYRLVTQSIATPPLTPYRSRSR